MAPSRGVEANSTNSTRFCRVTKDEKTARPRSTTKIAKTRSSAVFGAILLVAGMNCVNDLVNISSVFCGWKRLEMFYDFYDALENSLMNASCDWMRRIHTYANQRLQRHAATWCNDVTMYLGYLVSPISWESLCRVTNGERTNTASRNRSFPVRP